MTATSSFSSAGRTAPAPPVALLSEPSASGRRPPELDDPVWLRRRYERDGDMAIALELHVDRKTVRRSRERLGIPSLPVGRRRGVSVKSGEPATPQESWLFVSAQRFVREATGSGPASSKDHLWAKLRAVISADAAGDDAAFDDELIALSSAAGLVWDHRQKLRRAA